MSGEKITATLSTLTAIAILGAGVVAQPSRPPATDRTTVPAADRAASLESDLRYQLELAYRHDRGAFRQRTAELEQTLEVWHAAPKSPADVPLLEQWLRESISRSLPNKLQPLPPTPTFGADAKPAAEAGPSTESTATASENAAPRAEIAAEQPTVAANPEPAPTLKVPAAIAPIRVESPPKENEAAPAEEPAPELSAIVRNVALTAAETTPAPSDPPSAAEPSAPVSINLAELNARIRGYHDGLDEIDAAIVAAGDDRSLALATRLTRQIEQLAGQQRFAQLYFDSLTDRERLFVVEPRSMQETIELVEKLVSSIEPPAADDDFLAAAEQADPRDELLERLKAAAR